MRGLKMLFMLKKSLKAEMAKREIKAKKVAVKFDKETRKPVVDVTF